MLSLEQATQAIERYLRPDTFPLAIAVIQDPSAIPEKARRPKRDMGVSLSVCQGVSIARRYGWTLAMDAADLSCPIAQVAFGYEAPSASYASGSLAVGMYAKDQAAAQRTEAAVAASSPEAAGTIVIGPLARASFTPDVVAIYGNSAQIMVAVAAMLFGKGGALTSTFSARADCAEIINRTRLTGEAQVILPCYGDRVFGQTQDHEMAFSLPYHQLDAFVEGLEGCSKGGVRYPVPNYLRYQAEYPSTYQTVMREFAERDG
jgi:uncharacterized protein (DUF169 family)